MRAYLGYDRSYTEEMMSRKPINYVVTDMVVSEMTAFMNEGHDWDAKAFVPRDNPNTKMRIFYVFDIRTGHVEAIFTNE